MMELFHDPEFWVLVAFLIVVVGGAVKVGPSIGKSLDERAERIKAELDEARRLREDAQRTLAEYQLKQRDALKEAEAIIAQEEAKALADVRNTAVDIAVAAARRIIAEQLDARAGGALIDEAIAALPQRLH